MIRVSIEEAKAKLEELIEKAAMGEAIEITTNNKQVYLLPFVKTISEDKWKSLHLPKKGTRKLGSAEGQVWIADDFDAPLEDFKDYM